jgi:fructosamine-3-kinase
MRTFKKQWAGAPPGYFEAEALGLDWLRVPGGPKVAEVVGYGEDFLELKYIESGGLSRAKAFEFGKRLAKLHNTRVDVYGRTPVRMSGGADVMFVGPFRQPLIFDMRHYTDWATYFKRNLIRQALRMANFGKNELRQVDELLANLQEIAPEIVNDKPSILHGDLWSGNLLWGVDQVYLIDPIARTGHREEDLAMLHLFGTSYYEAIIEGYNSIYALADHFYRRIDLHNLFPLLVHTILFGGSYKGQFMRAVATLNRGQ